MIWLVIFAATWCALCLLFASSAGGESESAWTVLLAAGTIAALLTAVMFLGSHLARAVVLYTAGLLG